MMPAGTLIHYECRSHPIEAEARTTSGSPSIDTVLKLSDRTSYVRTHVHACLHTYTHTCTHTYTRVRRYAYTLMRAQACTHVHKHTYTLAYAHIYIRVHSRKTTEVLECFYETTGFVIAVASRLLDLIQLPQQISLLLPNPKVLKIPL
jgi:hypothetical protein